MITTPLRPSRAMRLAFLGALVCVWLPALAAADAAPDDLAARHQRERAMCQSGPADQDRAACLREADAAYAQMRRNGSKEQGAAFERNALLRCEALPVDDRKACQARMQGQGSTRGSVAGGGILRELVVTEPASAPRR